MRSPYNTQHTHAGCYSKIPTTSSIIINEKNSLVKNRETYCCTGVKRMMGFSDRPISACRSQCSSAMWRLRSYEHTLREHKNIYREPFTDNRCKDAGIGIQGKACSLTSHLRAPMKMVIARRPCIAIRPVMKLRPSTKCANNYSA